MSTDRLILKQIQSLPEQLKKEVLDFIMFLQKRADEDNKSPSSKRKFGSQKGKYKLSKDFDAPLEDFKEYM
jgi:mRNA-degrading endonuclease RelE of RelBE toxin-antitoxin system